MNNTPELLSPAGDLDKMRFGIAYGADAVYMAGTRFGMRAAATNFDDNALREGIAYAHAHGVKCYITVNIMPSNRDLPALPAYLELLQDAGADALIIADVGVLRMARRYAPKVPVHISTQTSILNHEAANYWADEGAERIVLARELSLEEIAEIRAKTPKELEIEAFVHGAMCISYSGRCLISQYMTGRDANHGACAQPCRWNYSLMEEKRPGQFFPVEEDGRGTYLYNSKDMCMIEHVPELIEADEVNKVSHREYYTGFYFGNQENGQHYGDSQYIREYEVVGMPVECDDSGKAVFALKNRFFDGEELELIQPGQAPYVFRAENVTDDEGTKRELFNVPQMRVHFAFPFKVSEWAILRKVKERPE